MSLRPYGEVAYTLTNLLVAAYAMNNGLYGTPVAMADGQLFSDEPEHDTDKMRGYGQYTRGLSVPVGSKVTIKAGGIDIDAYAVIAGVSVTETGVSGNRITTLDWAAGGSGLGYFGAIVEPGYALPPGYIGRLFTGGQVHHLICQGNATHHQADTNDAEMAYYVGRKATYETAYAAWLGGTYVTNVDGDIFISGPPTLSLDKNQILNDGVDALVVTCDLGDPSATDEIRWRVTAPDGSLFPEEGPEVDHAVAGVDTWQLTTSYEGLHIVRVETDWFGRAEIIFGGI